MGRVEVELELSYPLNIKTRKRATEFRVKKPTRMRRVEFATRSVSFEVAFCRFKSDFHGGTRNFKKRERGTGFGHSLTLRGTFSSLLHGM